MITYDDFNMIILRYDPTCPAAQLAAGGISRPPSAASRYDDDHHDHDTHDDI